MNEEIKQKKNKKREEERKRHERRKREKVPDINQYFLQESIFSVF